MKKLIYILVCSIFVASCGDVEEVIYSPTTGQTGVGFTTGSTSVTVPEGGVTVEVGVQATTLSAVDRTFSAAVNMEETTENSSADYTIGNIVIPANEFNGTLQVTFGNFDNLEDFVTKTLVVDLDLDPGLAVVGSNSTTFTYVKNFICNDVDLSFTFDDYPEETTWEITDADGMVVFSGGPYDGETSFNDSFFLEDGCYTFTIFDAFGDGICCGYGSGSYSLSCAIITLAEGGEFGGEESTDFCINQ